jgi:hypothetical protein
MPGKKEIAELNPNYEGANEELQWARRGLGDAEKF